MYKSGRYILSFIVFLLLVHSVSCDQIHVNKFGDSLLDSNALVSGEEKYGPMNFNKSINSNAFQQHAIVSHHGYQYVTYYNAQRYVCIARRKLPSGEWEVIVFEDYTFKNNDAHNTISLGICPNDGTIHMAFDHHVDTLHYRVSKTGAANNPEAVKWNASLFSHVSSALEFGKPFKLTYPRFFQTPRGDLQFCYRNGGSGNGRRMLIDYNSETGKWQNLRQIDSGEGYFKDQLGESNTRCSYPNGYEYGPNGYLHVTWVWREDARGSNHDLVYVYSVDEGMTWRNNSGDQLDDIPHVNSPDITVVDIPRGYGLMNTHGQAVDAEGRIHTVIFHSTDQSFAEAGTKPWESKWGPHETHRYHHYWRNESGEWMHTELPGIAGTRSKLFLDSSDNAFLIYTSEIASEETNIGTGDFIIMNATSKSNWTDWKIIHVEKGPFLNEMLGDYYRWKKEEILSVLVQEDTDNYHSKLRVLDFSF